MQDTEIRLNPNSQPRPDLAIFLGERLEQLNREKSPLTVVPNLAVVMVSRSESAVLGGELIEIASAPPEQSDIVAESLTPIGARTPLLPGFVFQIAELFV